MISAVHLVIKQDTSLWKNLERNDASHTVAFVLISYLVKALLGYKSDLESVCDCGPQKGSERGLKESVR